MEPAKVNVAPGRAEAIQDRDWKDDWSAKKDLLKVYIPGWEGPAQDFKQSVLGAKEKELIFELFPAADTAYDLTPFNYFPVEGPPVRHPLCLEVKNELMKRCNALAILNFNTRGNMIVDRITDYGKEKGEETIEKRKGIAGFLQNLSDKVSGKARLGKENEESED